MQTIEYRTQEKSKAEWGDGPWLTEPDKKQWVDGATGLSCLAVRAGHLGHWCGYVGVPKAHPWHGKHYDDVDVRVHGGLTFADKCAELTPEAWERWRERVNAGRDEATQYPQGDAARRLKEWAAGLESFDVWAEMARARFICHLVEPGEPDDVWWLGFDCGHAGDASPGIDRHDRYSYESEYRTLDYVERECVDLAQQIVAAAERQPVESVTAVNAEARAAE